MHNLNIPYFFLTNRTGAPHGYTLSLIYFLSNNSCNFIFNSVNFGILILYGDLETCVDLGIKLIVKSISHVGGNRGISSGDTS